MGNCQAAEAEAETALIQHPGAGGKVDRIYWSVSANEIMNSNPGNYVALVVYSPAARTENGAAVKQLKLLRTDDILVIGQVYRLISFEDVLKEFAAKKCVKLGKLLKERGALKSASAKTEEQDQVQHHLGSGGDGGGSSSRGGGERLIGGGGGGRQWRPALQSISEVET